MDVERIRWLGRVDELLGRAVSMRALAVLRIAAGPIVLLHLRPFLADALAGRIYRDVFYQPYASWYPDPPRSFYVSLLWVGALAAVAMSAGLLTKVATATTFGVVTYNVFLSTTHFHNNRAYLVIILAALAVTPCGRELSIDAWLRRRRGQPPLPTMAAAWPLWLLRLEASAVYFLSGFSKLVDPDWFGGTVTWQRVGYAYDHLVASPLPEWAITVLSDRSFHTFAAKAIVLTELFIALALWWRRTRYAAVWVAVCFHVSIELSAHVQVFSVLAIAALAIWAVPKTRDRTLVVDPTSSWQHRLTLVVRRLDWLARFRIEPATAGSALTLIDRRGMVLHGGAAVSLTLSRLPVTAWFALPFLLLPGVRRARRRPRVGMQSTPA